VGYIDPQLTAVVIKLDSCAKCRKQAGVRSTAAWMLLVMNKVIPFPVQTCPVNICRNN
jgi:hypothetical protein